MEAAWISALRGHSVVLYEKAAALGGQLLIAGVLPFKAQLKDLTGYMSGQIAELGVNIHLNTDVTTNFLKLIDFDVLILATGAKSHVPNVQRMDGSTVYVYDEVLSGSSVKGDNVIVVGGGLIGCETAIYLAENLKKRVTIVEQLPDVGGDLEPVFNKPGLMKRLSEDQIAIMTSSTLEKIEPEGAAVTSKGSRKVIHADSVVLAVGRSPVRELNELLKIDNREVFCIGDCVDPRRLPDAIHEGFAIGSNI